MQKPETRRTYELSAIATLVAPIAADFGIRKLSVFGSHAHGDETSISRKLEICNV